MDWDDGHEARASRGGEEVALRVVGAQEQVRDSVYSTICPVWLAGGSRRPTWCSLWATLLQ